MEFWVRKCTTGHKLADAYTGWGTALSREKPISKHVTGLWKPLRALISSEKKVVAATNIRKPAQVHTNKFKSHYVMFKQ